MELLISQWDDLVPFIAIGFAAQLVDGALGMAFGAIANSLLIGYIGIAPAQASYKVHVIKCFTTAVSCASHALAGNIDRRLFLRIVVPGTIGGALGAYGLAQIDGETIKPFVFGYLAFLGLLLVLKGIHGSFAKRTPKAVAPLGFAGGVLDSIGGGGWGPVVSSGLMLQGVTPREVVGTVNSAEFFVAVVISAAFLSQFGFGQLVGATLGLLIGGVLAAPLGAVVAKYLPTHVMLVLVGTVLSATTSYWLLVQWIAA